jgi:hypothetical protein
MEESAQDISHQKEDKIREEDVSGGLKTPLWQEVWKEGIAGVLMWQMWLALRAWGLRPSTPRSAGTRVLAVSEASWGLRPHTPGAFGGCRRLAGQSGLRHDPAAAFRLVIHWSACHNVLLSLAGIH